MAAELATPHAAAIVTKAPPWHGWVVADVFFSSLASGTFAVAALAILLNPEAFAPVARIAFLVALPWMLIDTVALVLDLGDPLRFHHMLRVFKPGSAMSVGVWAIVVFSGFAFLAFVAELIDAPISTVQEIAAAGLAPALVVSAYKGVLFSTTAQPVWRHDRWLGATFSVSAAAMGTAELIVIAFAMNREATYHTLFTLFALMMVLNLFAMRTSIIGLAEVANVQRRGRAVMLHRLLTYLGNLLPLLLLNPWANGSARTYVAAAIVLLVALAFRWQIVNAPRLAASDD